MAEYIERDKALEEFDKWIDETGAIPKGTSYYYECRACIEDVPSADVVEVVHGEWHTNDKQRICSNCLFFYTTNGSTIFNYCPMCGAKMDGEGRCEE